MYSLYVIYIYVKYLIQTWKIKPTESWCQEDERVSN